MTTYTLAIRDEAPLEEVQDALRIFARSYPYSLTTNTLGEIILWSSHAWNVGTLKFQHEGAE